MTETTMRTNERGQPVNMSDCTACPKCGSPYRWLEGSPVQVRCRDCGLIEPWTTDNGRPGVKRANPTPEVYAGARALVVAWLNSLHATVLNEIPSDDAAQLVDSVAWHVQDALDAAARGRRTPGDARG